MYRCLLIFPYCRRSGGSCTVRSQPAQVLKGGGKASHGGLKSGAGAGGEVGLVNMPDPSPMARLACNGPSLLRF